MTKNLAIFALATATVVGLIAYTESGVIGAFALLSAITLFGISVFVMNMLLEKSSGVGGTWGGDGWGSWGGWDGGDGDGWDCD